MADRNKDNRVEIMISVLGGIALGLGLVVIVGIFLLLW
jgi:hypothetical protein